MEDGIEWFERAYDHVLPQIWLVNGFLYAVEVISVGTPRQRSNRALLSFVNSWSTVT